MDIEGYRVVTIDAEPDSGLLVFDGGDRPYVVAILRGEEADAVYESTLHVRLTAVHAGRTVAGRRAAAATAYARALPEDRAGAYAEGGPDLEQLEARTVGALIGAFLEEDPYRAAKVFDKRAGLDSDVGLVTMMAEWLPEVAQARMGQAAMSTAADLIESDLRHSDPRNAVLIDAWRASPDAQQRPDMAGSGL